MAIRKMESVIKETIKSIANHDGFPHCFTIADLGCSSGPNTLLAVSNIINGFREACKEKNLKPPQYQVCLNDLFINDFNSVFESLPMFYAKHKKEKGENSACYVSAVPGSFHGRLFPDQSVHFFHSSSSRHWLSEVEVIDIIHSQGSFSLDILETFGVDMDPYGAGYGNEKVSDEPINHGKRAAKIMRAAIEPVLVTHYGNSAMDLLFKKLEKNVDNLATETTKYFMIEYNARVHVKSKLHYFPLLKDKLGLDRCVLFMETCFWRWLDLTYVENEESLIYYMLYKQKISYNYHYDLPLIYSVNGHTLHFGRHEFWLISGFKFGFLSFRKFREGDITFRDRVFPKKIGEYLKNIDLLSLIEDEYRFSSLFNLDSIRVCLLLSLEVIFMGHELGSAIDDVILRMVEDLDVQNDFPWGEHMWRKLYGAIRNVNLNHQQGHHKALEMNPNFVPTYSLSRFLLSFKILESSCVTDRWWCKRTEEILRGCSWSKHFSFQNWENYGQLLPEAKKINYDLYHNKCEAQSKWFKKSTDFSRCILQELHLLNMEVFLVLILKKLSLARTHREKDEDVESGCQTSTKEVSLKDRVKAMEGLFTSLMILPKEIKSLKARVYKLETIINMVNFGDLGDKYWSDKDGEFFSFNVSPHQSTNKDPVNELVDALDDLVDESYNFTQNGVVEVEKDLSEHHCKFPWCNEISVDGRFWDALIGLDDKRLSTLNSGCDTCGILDNHVMIGLLLAVTFLLFYFKIQCRSFM
nr:phospholipase-like, aminotransferase-like mobile domain protein [Tanacetum cinerariifolium]